MSSILASQPTSIQCLWAGEIVNLTTATFRLPDGDINGIGVVLAFLLGAYIPLIITVAFYACGLIPPDFLNDYDRQFLRIKLRPSARWVTGLRKGFFAFSIQQLVLGIGILSAGFAKISEMVVFDFHTVIYMAWMSSTAHLFTLMLLRDRFQSSPLFRTLELLSMLVLLLMLCVALFPTTNWAWANSVLTRSGCSEPSYCSATQKSVSALWQIARQTNLSGGVSPQGGLSYAIIIISYISQTTSLLQQRRQFFRNFFHKPLTWIGRAIPQVSAHGARKKPALLMTFCNFMLIGIYCFLLAILDLLGSFAFRLWILAVALGWGTMQLFIPRFFVLPACVRGTLSEWSFGQILPMIILLTPLYGVFEYLSMNSSDADSQHLPKMESQPIEVSIQHAEPPISTLFRKMREEDPASPQILDKTLYSSAYFKMLLVLLSLIAVGSPVGFFSETVKAYTGPDRPREWWNIDWHMWPDVVATMSALCFVLILAAIGPFFSKKLSS